MEDKSPSFRIWSGGPQCKLSNVPLRFCHVSKFQASDCLKHQHKYKKERSMTFKIRQNTFLAEALHRTWLGELTSLPRPPSRLGRGHPSPFPAFGARHASSHLYCLNTWFGSATARIKHAATFTYLHMKVILHQKLRLWTTLISTIYYYYYYYYSI